MDDKRMAVLLNKVDALGWSVYEDEDGWDIRQSSPAGEDFGFYIHKSAAKDADDFIREVRKFADDFDPDENIEMWVEARKNGVGGVPDIRTLVKDADDEQDMLDELADALEGVRYSFDIGFVNPETGQDDETEFDVETEEEALGLFENDFCKDNGWKEVPEIQYVECFACEDDDGEDGNGESELNAEQTARLDEIDNAMYEFLKVLLEKDEREFLWNMEYIGGATDLVADFMYDRGFDIHRPAIIWDGDDSYTIDGDYHKSKEGGKA